ncbi:MAG: holo-[acyl-carrier-protein] synthase [Candidatus Marinimicrobia bacterium]|nr:holo-[acyl-carrier-protein] synthase [Candidatus Neomarinimicrobiota bacterium]
MILSELYIGTDLVDIDRIKISIEKYQIKFLNRVFSTEEQEYCQSKSNPAIHYAGRFAAKEAVIKSIKSSGFDQPIDLRSIRIINNADGSPYVNLDLEYNGSVKVSISHTETHAIAFALSELNH